MTGTKWTWGYPQHQVPKIKGFFCIQVFPIELDDEFPFLRFSLLLLKLIVLSDSLFSSSYYDPSDFQIRTFVSFEEYQGEINVHWEGNVLLQTWCSVTLQTAVEAFPKCDASLLVSAERRMLSLETQKSAKPDDFIFMFYGFSFLHFRKRRNIT